MCSRVPTCKGSVIDFFVIDRRLMHAVLYVKRLDNFGLVPHSPVRMALMAEPRKMMVRMLVAPQCVPARLPAGCLTKEQFEAGKEGFEREGGVGPWMNSWMRKAELVWAGIGGKEGKALGRACGRADGPRMVWKSALGPPADKVLFSTVISRSWCKIAGWCTTIKQAREHAVSRDNREHPLARAAGVAQRRIRAAAKWKWKPGAQREALWSFIAAFEEVDIRGDMNKLVAMEAWAVKESEEAARNAAAEATTKFKQWLQEGEAKGIARQHAMSKCPGQWVPGKMVKERAGQDDALAMVLRQWEGVYEENQIGRLVATIQARGAELEVPANIQQEVDVEGAKWAAEWAAGETVEECRWPDDLEELASINAHSIREAAATFADGVGLGWERLHPKALCRLPDAMLDEMGEVMMAAEGAGSWGEAVGVVITALIPKGDGGWRPIGLLPTIVRLWARVRGRIVKEWEAANDRAYLFGGRGKGAQVAAWKFAARAEAARLDKAAFAAVLLDLEKAFDKVPHHKVVDAARRWGYPMKVLRLSLHGYRMDRVIGVGGVFGAVIKPQRGIAAGSAHATRELRALMIGVFDEVNRLCPSVSLTVYVDDGTLESVGTERTVTEEAVKATVVACMGLEGCGMVLSRVKNKVIASSKELGGTIAMRLQRWGVVRCREAKMLGVGTVAATRRTTAVLTARIAAFGRRRGQFGMLKRAGVDIARLLRTGGLAGAQFGQAALGIADYQLMQLRRSAAGLIGGTAMGKDPNMTLITADARMGDRADPAFAAHADVVTQWAGAVWEGLLPIDALHRSMRKAKIELVNARKPWAVVKGPAAALVATVARLGWTMVDATLAFNDLKEEVAFCRDSPAAIKRLVHDSVRRWRWRLAGMAGEGSVGGVNCEGPVWKPVADLVGRGKWRDPGDAGKERIEDVTLTKGEQGALRSALVGGQWPQARLYTAALTEVPWCALCLWHGVEIVGSLLHRIHECPHVERRASSRRPHDLGERWRKEGGDGQGRLRQGASAMEWERGLACGPKVTREAPQEKFQWVVEPCGLVSDGRVYLDGSMYDAFDERYTVLGWAFAIVVGGEVVGSARGVPPPYVRSIPAAEAWALAMAVGSVDVAAARFFTDCKSVRDLARAGMRRATAANQINARIWNLTFARTDGACPSIEWIPAHLSESHVGVAVIGDGSKLTREQWEMNSLVDDLAKQAAKEVRRPREEVNKYLCAMRRAAVIAAWIGKATFAANNGSEEPRRDSMPTQGARRHHEKKEGARRKMEGVGARRQARPVTFGGHALVKRGLGWGCVVCKKEPRE